MFSVANTLIRFSAEFFASSASDMSHTIITSCKDSGSKGDDTLIILVNSDGTLSVDPETLKKLLANQHQTSPISLVHLGDTKNADTNNEDDDDDADNRVNLTVEGYYPPTPAPSSPTPPPTPVADSNVSTDGGGSDTLAESITEILRPEDVEQLETALQSEHAKEILGDVVLDMLHAGEDGMGDEAVHRQHGSVGLDHCYASLAAPQPPSATTSPGPTTTTTPTPVGHPAIRGTGRGRGRPRGTVQTKLTLPTGASLVPVVQQLVMPQSTVTLQSPFTNTTSQATAPLQRADNQVLSANLVPCTVMLNKVPMQSKPVAVAPISAGGGDGLSVKSAEAFGQVIPKKKGMGRGRVLTRGGIRSVPGRGRPVQRISSQDEAKNKQLADEMAATVQALALAEDVQFANIESMDQSSDSDRVIPLVNKLPAKKPLKVYRRSVDGIKTIKVLKPERPTPKLKTPRTSVSSESSNYEDKHGTEHKKEKVIVMPVEPQITPASLSALVMAQNSSQMSVTTSTPTPSPAPTPSLTMGKKYPKRENRKPPAHLAEAFGPALFSTPDIIRRVSTDKNPPHTPTTTAAAMAPAISATAKLEEELGLADQDGMMDTISSQVNRQEDQLLEEALLLEDLSSIPTDDILQDENPVTPDTEKVTAPDLQIANMSKKPKTQKQTSLAAFFPVIIQEKGEPVKESVKSTAVVGEAVQPAPTLGVRKLPPIELPATRGATKRASLQKETTQDVLVKSPEVVKKVANSSETRKSTDSKKSTESRKSTGRSESEDVSDDEGSPNDEDDPNRLWCICKRPHNNRFMICCDVCEDWFHGKCVGITKAMGEKMEEQEIDWMCPNCKKKKKQEEAGKQNSAKKVATPVEPVVETPPSTSKEKKAEASKVIVQQQKLVVVTQDTPKNTKGPEVRISKVARKSMDDKKSTEVREADTSKETAHNSTTSNVQEANVAGPGVDCIVCHKLALSGGVYCSDECIARHTSESLAVIDKSSVIVFEKKTGRIYSGPNMPTPSTLTSWLMAHPSYEVMRPGVLPTSKFYNQKPANPGPTRPPLRQTTLQPRPQGIQLIAALPQVPPIEVPPKKNQKTETPKNKPQPKGQQQITSLLKAQQAKQEAKVQQAKQELKVQQSKPEVKVQAKQEVKAQQIKQDVKKVQQAKQDVTEAKAAPNKGLTSPTPGIKPVKETKKALQVVKKVAPTQPKKVVREEREEGRSRETEEQTVRTSVKKTLQEVLSARLLDVSDIKLNEDQIRKIVTQIEEELYLLFKDTSTKYKAKYRSLMFNIKDVKNLTLFRKIADKSISPEQLVRLSPEELASQELAQWREQEARHQLEMIKKTELDMMQQAKTVVMKTHKGEQVVENDDGLGAKVLETSVEIEPLMAETPSVSIIVNKPKENKLILKISKHFKKDKKEDKHKERKHGHKSHHKSHDRSRSRHRHRSDSDRRSRSKSRKRPNSQPKSRSVSLEAPETKEKSLREGRSRSIHRNEDKERSKSKPPSVRERSKSRGRSTLSDRSKSTERARSKSMHRERSKSRPRERSKSRPRERSKSRPRERSKSRPREMSKSKPRGRSTSTDRTRSKSRARERSMSRPRKMSLDFEEASTPIETAIPSSSNVEEFEAIPLVKPQFYEEIREIVHDVVAEEESGANLEDDLSDHEPSSTVNISTPPLDENEGENESVKPSVWRGTLEMPDVAKFSTSIQEVSGICGDLAVDLPDTLDCVGRIGPEIAWDYIAKMKKSGTKQILVVRFTADTEEDEMSYLSFYSYLSTRNRLGVVGNNSKMIKDFYVLPLPSHSPVPQVLLPLDGPGFEDYRPHLLLGIIVRTRRKRTLTDKDIPFVPKIPKKSERSYTPPLPEEESHTPTQQHPDTESFTPPHSPKPPRIIKLKSSSRKATNSPTVSDDFVLEDGDTPYTPEDEDVPYSPGDGADEDTGRTPSPCSEELQRKVDKLQSMINKIEQEKQKIGNMATISGISSSEGIIMSRPEDEDDLEEAYSPSGSITPPPPGGTSYLDKNKISLPSDLQAIITSLKKKRDEPKSMDLKSDPIVQAYRSNDETFSPEPDELEPDEEGLIRTPPIEGMLPIQSVEKTSTTVPKINRDPRQRAQFSLSQISDEELLKKASEMGFMNPENPDPIPDNTKAREPPPPGLEEEYDPFNADTNEFQPPIVHQPPQPPMPMFTNQPFPPPPQTFNSEYPHPPIAPNFHPPGQFHPTPMFQAPPPLPPLPPPSHIPFTNPQPPPPQPIYPPPMPPAQPAPLPPPPPRESPERIRPSLTRKKLSKKLKKDKDKEHKSKDRVKSKKDRRRYSESPVKDYDSDKFEKSRDRDKYSSKKRERRDTWRTYDKETVPDKRREFREYETPVMSGPPIPHPPPPMGGPPPVFGMPGPMRGMPMRGRFQRGMRGIFRGRGFQGPPMRGFHRGGFHPRGHYPPVAGPPPPPAGPSRPINIQQEYEEDIRRFEEQRKQQKNLDRKRWRKELPPSSKKRRSKDDDSD